MEEVDTKRVKSVERELRIKWSGGHNLHKTGGDRCSLKYCRMDY